MHPPVDDNVSPGIWTFSEMSSAVIAACLPTLKPLLKKLFPHLSPRTYSNHEQELGPCPYANRQNAGPGMVSRVLGSAFSKREVTEEDRVLSKSRYFKIGERRIVQAEEGFTRLGVDFEG